MVIGGLTVSAASSRTTVRTSGGEGAEHLYEVASGRLSGVGRSDTARAADADLLVLRIVHEELIVLAGAARSAGGALHRHGTLPSSGRAGIRLARTSAS